VPGFFMISGPLFVVRLEVPEFLVGCECLFRRSVAPYRDGRVPPRRADRGYRYEVVTFFYGPANENRS
jgi:hypothetical protein